MLMILGGGCFGLVVLAVVAFVAFEAMEGRPGRDARFWNLPNETLREIP